MTSCWYLVQINYNNSSHYFAVCLCYLPKMLPSIWDFCRNSDGCGDHGSTASTAFTTGLWGSHQVHESAGTWGSDFCAAWHYESKSAFRSNQRTTHLRTRPPQTRCWSWGQTSHNVIFNEAGWAWWKTRELRQSVGVVECTPCLFQILVRSSFLTATSCPFMFVFIHGTRVAWRTTTPCGCHIHVWHPKTRARFGHATESCWEG